MMDEEEDDSSDDMPLDPSDPLSRILEELSHHDKRYVSVDLNLLSIQIFLLQN